MPTLSGITFIRNGIELAYPFLEVLKTLAALCDEVVIAVGTSTDGTRQAIVEANIPKLRIIDTEWDESNNRDGKELARQTMIALRNARYEWCLYLQGDEIIHEEDYERVHAEITRADRDPKLDALLFRWLHFYGSYDYIGVGRQWYRREIRAFRNTGKVISWADAQGFRTRDDRGIIRKLHARQTEIRIFHYGWVRPPRAHHHKYLTMHKLHHGTIPTESPYNNDFPTTCYQLRPFQGRHPAVILPRIERDRQWTQLFDPSHRPRKPLIVALSDWIESHTGWRIGEYKNFIEVK